MPNPLHQAQNIIFFSQWDTSTGLKWGYTLRHACLYYCHGHEKGKPGVAHWSQKEEEMYGGQSLNPRLPAPAKVTDSQGAHS